MKNNNGKIKIPKHLDRKLLVSFRFKFISRLIRDMGTVWPKKIFQGGLVTACAVLLIVGVTSFQAPSVRYTEAAVSFAYAEAELQNEMIKHQEILYREGADKVSFTQSLEEFDPAHAVSRSEVIERWQHGNHSLAIIIHGITETLPEVHLNFELDDYIHVFRYQSGDCPEHMSLVTGMKDCLSEEKLTVEEKKVRSFLDSAHDLATLYTGVVSFDPKQDAELLDWVQNMEYVGTEKNNSKQAVFLLEHTENLHSILTFDAKSGSLVKRSIFVSTPDNEYEMTVVEYGDIEWVALTEASEIFNPKTYSFEQTDLVPLN